MDLLKRLHDAMAYVESCLCGELDMEKLAQMTGVSGDGFLRFFSYLTGMTLNTYIRRRRLTLAAYELQNGAGKIVDVAVKYGWDSADAFARAFKRQHGITPVQARDSTNKINVYSPVSFQIMMQGARKMDFHITELADIEVLGIAWPFEGQGYKTREELRHDMWSEECGSIPGQISAGGRDHPCNASYDGIWYGLWQNGHYCIARAEEYTSNRSLERFIIPSGTYAVFKTERGGLAWEEFPRLFQYIFESWLPNAGYTQKGNKIVEVYHLWTDAVMRRQNRYYEVWLPVQKSDMC